MAVRKTYGKPAVSTPTSTPAQSAAPNSGTFNSKPINPGSAASEGSAYAKSLRDAMLKQRSKRPQQPMQPAPMPLASAPAPAMPAAPAQMGVMGYPDVNGMPNPALTQAMMGAIPAQNGFTAPIPQQQAMVAALPQPAMPMPAPMGGFADAAGGVEANNALLEAILQQQGGLPAPLMQF